jgi:hypothetical protein
VERRIPEKDPPFQSPLGGDDRGAPPAARCPGACRGGRARERGMGQWLVQAMFVVLEDTERLRLARHGQILAKSGVIWPDLTPF